MDNISYNYSSTNNLGIINISLFFSLLNRKINLFNIHLLFFLYILDTEVYNTLFTVIAPSQSTTTILLANRYTVEMQEEIKSTLNSVYSFFLYC